MSIKYDQTYNTLSVTDSSVTNASLVVQSQGTGAVDLAAGSSGVNISNGGTVTAITVTNNGAYTTYPTASVSAPTTAGGVTATLTVTSIYASTATVAAGGTGYTLNDILTVVGGTTIDSAVQFQVTGVSGGVVTTVSRTSNSRYSVLPSSPASVTGGTGSGCTLNITFYSPQISISNAGSGYVEQPTVSFSGTGTTAAAYATVGSAVTLKSLHRQISFNTSGGESVRVTDLSGLNDSYITLSGSHYSRAYIGADGSATNVTLQVGGTKGTGGIVFATGPTGISQLQVAHTASAVNYVQVTGAATGSTPTISAQGSDANVSLTLLSKASSGIYFQTRGGGTARNALVLGDNGAASVNYLTISSNVASSAPSISATGSDTNIGLVLQPKGTGALQAQQTDSTITGGNARGANAVDWQTSRSAASQVASGSFTFLGGGFNNSAGGYGAVDVGGAINVSNGVYSAVVGGYGNNTTAQYSSMIGGFGNAVSSNGQFGVLGGGSTNTLAGFYNVIVGGFTNSATSGSAVTTQSATMNGTTAVTLSGSNANIKVGQYITGTSIAGDTYVAAISGTSLTLSKVASGSSTSTLSFYTPHGVVVGGGNNQATGSYSFIGGGGDAGTAANRNVASGDWSFVGGGRKNTASGASAFVGGGGVFSVAAENNYPNTASGSASFVGGGLSNTAGQSYASVLGGLGNTASGIGSTAYGIQATTRSITGYIAYASCDGAVAYTQGVSQGGILTIGRQTTDATPTVLTSNASGATTTNQVILPNNSAYYFKGSVVAGVTGAGNTKGWTIEGVIKRGANAASTAIVGTATVTSSYADAGASTWAITATADTTNGGLAITATGQASTTIRWVCKIETTEMTY